MDDKKYVVLSPPRMGKTTLGLDLYMKQVEALRRDPDVVLVTYDFEGYTSFYDREPVIVIDTKLEFCLV